MIYLDYAASAPPYPEAIAEMSRVALEAYGNPGGLHRASETARGILQESRKKIAQALGAAEYEVFFTSGGTEANNWAVKLGCRLGRGRTILVSAAEHKSVLEAARSMEAEGFRVKLLYPDGEGIVSPETVEAALDGDTGLLCVQAVNNETGAMQDVQALARLARAKKIPFLCDGVQSFGHTGQKLHQADLLSISAHKLGGPRGVGCLVVRYPWLLQPLHHGGGQEQGLRSGTENLPAIAGFALASQLACAQQPGEARRLEGLSRQLLEGICALDPGIRLNGGERRHPGILNLYFPGISGEAMAMYLDLEGICVSPGAACSARDSQPSHVLLAMGASRERARNSLRFSLGRNTTEEDIHKTIAAVEAIHRRRRKEL